MATNGVVAAVVSHNGRGGCVRPTPSAADGRAKRVQPLLGASCMHGLQTAECALVLIVATDQDLLIAQTGLYGACRLCKANKSTNARQN